jgi:hypothetical protein
VRARRNRGQSGSGEVFKNRASFNQRNPQEVPLDWCIGGCWVTPAPELIPVLDWYIDRTWVSILISSLVLQPRPAWYQVLSTIAHISVHTN